MTSNNTVEWICTCCGNRVYMPPYGRPATGICHRKPKDKNGKGKPHSWVKNRTS